MATLVLVVEQPDTVAGLTRRIRERFPDAEWAKNIADSSVSNLERQGLVRPRRGGQRRSLCVVEATEHGKERVRHWLADSSVEPPGLDDLRTKLQHIRGSEDLALLLDAIRLKENTCFKKFAAAHAELKIYEHERRRAEAGSGGWQDVVDTALITDEAKRWGTYATRLKSLRECLEGEGLGAERTGSDGSV